jgi:hypothetical protein
MPGKNRESAILAGQLYRWLKRWWVRELNRVERTAFRRNMVFNQPMPRKIRKLAIEHGFRL